MVPRFEFSQAQEFEQLLSQAIDIEITQHRAVVHERDFAAFLRHDNDDCVRLMGEPQGRAVAAGRRVEPIPLGRGRGKQEIACQDLPRPQLRFPHLNFAILEIRSREVPGRTALQ